MAVFYGLYSAFLLHASCPPEGLKESDPISYYTKTAYTRVHKVIITPKWLCKENTEWDAATKQCVCKPGFSGKKSTKESCYDTGTFDGRTIQWIEVSCERE